MKLSKYATGPVQCGSIHEIYRRPQEEGYRIGESALRAWVKDGLIPSIRCGNKALVLYEDVLAFYHQRLANPSRQQLDHSVFRAYICHHLGSLPVRRQGSFLYYQDSK